MKASAGTVGLLFASYCFAGMDLVYAAVTKIILKEGSGQKTKKGDVSSVHYTAWFTETSKEFGMSRERN